MENLAFDQRLRILLENTPDLLATLPDGFTLYSITPVRLEDWVPGFVSTRAGRWNREGEPAKYFADSISTCLAELIGTLEEDVQACVCEHWQLTSNLRVLDTKKLPPDILADCFKPGGAPPEKWRHCHALLQCLPQHPGLCSVRALKAPSAYGMALGIPGFTLAANPHETPLKMVHHAQIC